MRGDAASRRSSSKRASQACDHAVRIRQTVDAAGAAHQVLVQLQRREIHVEQCAVVAHTRADIVDRLQQILVRATAAEAAAAEASAWAACVCARCALDADSEACAADVVE